MKSRFYREGAGSHPSANRATEKNTEQWQQQEASTAKGDKAKTLLKTSLSTGEEGIAGTQLEIKMIPMEKKDAKIPVVTT